MMMEQDELCQKKGLKLNGHLPLLLNIGSLLWFVGGPCLHQDLLFSACFSLGCPGGIVTLPLVFPFWDGQTQGEHQMESKGMEKVDTQE